MEEFEKLMPVTTSVEKQQKQRQKMFLALTLVGLSNDLDSVHDQILDYPTVAIVEVFCCSPQSRSDLITSSRFLCSHISDIRNSQPKCSYSSRLGRTRKVCYSVHGQPPKNTHVSQTDIRSPRGIFFAKGEYSEFL